MGTDFGDGGIPLRQLPFIGAFDCFLPGDQHFVDLSRARVPSRLIQSGKRLLVVSTERSRLFSVKLRQLLLVPEDQMVYELNDGMILVRVFPRRLLRSQSLNSDLDRHKPLFLVMRLL